MKEQSVKPGYAKVWINSRHIIVCELVGLIDESVTDVSIPQTDAAAKELTLQGRPVLLLIDASRATSQTSGARLATKELAKMRIQKIAVCGKEASLMLAAQYLMHITKAAKFAKSFRTFKNAQDWLINPFVGASLSHDKSIVGAVFIGGVGIVALLASFLLKTIIVNPVIAVTFVALSAALLVFGLSFKRGGGARKSLNAVLACWVMILASLVWLRVFWGIDSSIDHWLLSDIVTPYAYITPRSAFNFALVGVALLVLAMDHRRKWEQYLLQFVLFAIFINSVLTVFGSAFGVNFAESIGFIPMPTVEALCFMAAASSMWFLLEPTKGFKRAFESIEKYQLVIITFSVMLIATGALWQLSLADLRSNINSAAQRAYAEQQNSFDERLASYTSVLYGYKSLFEASNEVTSQEFETYFDSSETKKNYPGLNGIAFIKKVLTEDQQQFVDHMRQQPVSVNPNFADFNIRPQSDQNTLYVLSYIEPNDVEGAVGYDLSSSETRRNTLEKSRDTGEIATTGTVNINAALPGDAVEKLGFFSTLPIYSGKVGSSVSVTVEDRQSSLLGYVNASFVYETLFADVFKGAVNSDVKFIVKDLATDTVLYGQNSDISSDAIPAYQGNININGRIWQLQMYSNSNFGASDSERLVPVIVIVGGIVLSFLAAFLTLSQILKRQEAMGIAEIMTEDLSNERNNAVVARGKNDTILASIGDAVFAIDNKNRITLFNYAAEVISGHSSKEAVGKKYDQILKFEHLEKGAFRATSSFIKSALDGRIAHIQDNSYLVRKDGSRVVVSDSAAPIKDDRKKIVGAVVVFRDATRETELSKAKDEFVSLASHQLRTPLSAINWYSEMLLSGDAGKLNKEQSNYLQEIYSGNQRMIKLVNSLLDVSRIDLGKFINEPVSVSIGSVVKSLRIELSESIKDKKIDFIFHISKKVPHVKADPKLIRIVMQNLFSNAIKYSRMGGKIEVNVRLAGPEDRPNRRCPANKACIIMTVKDEGIGIPKMQQPHIFEKLFRADNAQTQEVEGNGLGLYLVREIVTRLGGLVWFTSEENKGTTFNVIVPLETERINSK
ncbi:MAG: CHASE domain-containing protein [Candidatus Woesebacteria bacterium]|jgi:PAS domain S-box-containing protein